MDRERMDHVQYVKYTTESRYKSHRKFWAEIAKNVEKLHRL